jgi:hypothetical protein
VKTSRFLILCLPIAVLALVVLPEVLHSYSHYESHKRVTKERETVAALVQAGDSGYDELVRLLPTLRYGNVSDALNGILVQSKRDRVADLCRAYAACGKNHNTKTAIARTLGTVGDSRAGTVLLKDLESVWSELTLIQYDTQIEVLGELKAKEAADLLLRILRHRYSWEGSAWRIKENTLVALGKIGDQRALPDAGTYVESEADWYVKQGSLNYLININNREAKAALWKAYRNYNEPEVALCLVQVGELSVLPEVRARLKEWLDKFDTGGWVKTDYWGVFYCTHALLIVEDVDAIPQLRRALTLFKDGSDETRRYVSEAASGYTSKVLLDTTRAEALVPDLKRFLEKHPTAVGP